MRYVFNCHAPPSTSGVSRRAAGLWLERRKELGHPLGLVPPAPLPPPPPQAPQQLQKAQADFVLEVGCEELPPHDVASALEQLRSVLPPGSRPGAAPTT